MTSGPPSSPGPGWFVRGLLGLLLPADRRDDVLGDLEEALHRRRRSTRPPALLWWYTRQVVGYVVVALGDARQEMSTRRAHRAPGPEGFTRALAYDLRYAARSLRRAPLFTATAVLTLAIAIGGNTAVFSLVNGVLLAPLPYPEPDRLVAVHETFDGQSFWSAAPRSVLAWEERSELLDGIAWSEVERRGLEGADGPVPVGVALVSANFLEVLGIAPAVGRGFAEVDEVRDAAPVAVLTAEFWRTRLGGRGDVVGESVSLDGIPHTVLGILPDGGAPDFVGPHDLLVPRAITEAEVASRGRVLQAVARLGPGVGLESARREMEAITVEHAATTGGMQGWGVRLRPLREQLVGDVRPALLVLLGAVGMVLLVACVNLGNLLLARGTRRRAELAVRTALGASAGRLTRLLLLEASLLGLLGGALGLALAAWGVRSLPTLVGDGLPRLNEVGIDGGVLVFCMGLSLGAGLLFGLLPALHARRVGTEAARMGGARTVSPDRRQRRLRVGFVALQLASVMVLLAAAGLMTESFRRLQRTDPGFVLEDRLVLHLSVPEARYPTPDHVATFFEGLVERLEATPGVTAAGVVTHLPLSGDDWTSLQVVESLPEPVPGEEPNGGFEAVGPGYFEALGIPVVGGRTFTRGEFAEGAPVVLVDEVMAEGLGIGRSAVGERVRFAPAGPRGEWHTVVGVVGAVRYELRASPRPQVYIPERRLFPEARERDLVVRVEPGSAEGTMSSVRASLRGHAPELAVASIRPLRDVASASLWRARLQSGVLSAFGVVGLVLGAIGVYGVVSYTVGGRTREIGVRLALGARRREVLLLIMREVLSPVLVGLGAGLLAAIAGARLFSAALFGVRPHEPAVLATLALVLLTVATAAAAVPALNAVVLDPARTLRPD